MCAFLSIGQEENYYSCKFEWHSPFMRQSEEEERFRNDHVEHLIVEEIGSMCWRKDK